MNNPIFDFETGDCIYPTSDTMGINSDGNLVMRMSDNMAMDMDSGEIHFISGWTSEDDK